MALSDKEISALYFEALGSQHLREQDRKMVTRFAHAVESEVRKSDDALLQAALDALTCTGESDDPGHRCGHCDDYVDRNGQVRAALRARLEGKPCA